MLLCNIFSEIEVAVVYFVVYWLIRDKVRFRIVGQALKSNRKKNIFYFSYFVLVPGLVTATKSVLNSLLLYLKLRRGLVSSVSAY